MKSLPRKGTGFLFMKFHASRDGENQDARIFSMQQFNKI